jgi:hypothetical protein
MSIDERLRTELPAAFDDFPDSVEAELSSVLLRAARRNRLRRISYGAGLAAAGVLAGLVIGLGGDDSHQSMGPAQPADQVRVLDSERGSADAPAPLDPGRYVVPFIGAPNSAPWGQVEVPAGWAQDRLTLATGPDLDPHLRRLELLVVDRVAPDPCAGTLRAVDDDVDSIVAALSEQTVVRPSETEQVAIGGVAGQVIQFGVPEDLDVESCWDGQSLRPLGLGASYTTVFPGWTYRIWVLDVEGGPQVVLAAHGPEASENERAELFSMVHGLTFVAPH